MKFKIAVSNLRGEVIWESYDPKSKWDGTYYEKQVPSGYYVWEVSYFESQTNENIRVRGNLMVF